MTNKEIAALQAQLSILTWTLAGYGSCARIGNVAHWFNTLTRRIPLVSYIELEEPEISEMMTPFNLHAERSDLVLCEILVNMLRHLHGILIVKGDRSR